MRKIVALPLLFAAACGSTSAEKNEAAPAAASSIAAGQWELTSEVTGFRTVDQGAPKIDTPVGTRATQSICVSGNRPSDDFFAGEGFACTNGAYYARNGRLNVTLSCTREGLDGQISISADGDFTADSVTYTRNLRTVLSSDGDVEIDSRVTARRTGDCAPAAEGDNSAAAR